MAKTGLNLTSGSKDIELVRKALEGSEKAFSILHAKYSVAVAAVIRRIVTDNVEAEDISIESFEKAFQNLHTFDQNKKFSTWLFAIARNNALDHKNRTVNQNKVIDSTPIDANKDIRVDVADGQPSPEENIISTQDHERFLDCIGGLPELYREVAQMCFVDNLGYKEIAEKTDLPINTVKTRIRRAKESIISKMMEEE